jgi:hypothetical protein
MGTSLGPRGLVNPSAVAGIGERLQERVATAGRPEFPGEPAARERVNSPLQQVLGRQVPMAVSSELIRVRPNAGRRSLKSTAAKPRLISDSATGGLLQREITPSPRQVRSQPGGTVSTTVCSMKMDQDRWNFR